jgi:hypothetical protein
MELLLFSKLLGLKLLLHQLDFGSGVRHLGDIDLEKKEKTTTR